MKTIEFNEEQILALKNYERVGRVIAETSYGTINTRALDAKAVLDAYFDIYGQKVCTSCPSDAIAAIKRIYKDYDEFLKPKPKAKPKAKKVAPKKAAPKKTVAKKAAPKPKK